VRLTDLGWITEIPHRLSVEDSTGRFSDCRQRTYILPKPGHSLSLVKGAIFHVSAFAWEGAVIDQSGLSYSTPLTSDVEVFATDEEAMEWVVKAYRWALTCD
jgi:hypothetical protein